jgi:hypothetical protein
MKVINILGPDTDTETDEEPEPEPWKLIIMCSPDTHSKISFLFTNNIL